MHQEQENSWELPSRQPVSGMAIAIVKAIILSVKAFWPILAIVLLRQNTGGGGENPYLKFFYFIPVFIILRSVVDYFYLRFYIHENNLILRKGFISKKIITIPFERIHTVNLDQHFIHKLFKITSLKIDTAGSSKSEAVIDAIEFKKAEALKDFLLSESRLVKASPETVEITPEQEKANSKTILHADIKDIFKIGITANHIQAFFIIFAFLVSVVQNLEEIFGDRVINLLKESASGVSYTASILLFTGMAVLVITIVVSLIRTLLLYINFYLVETARGYKIEWGLLNSRELLIPYNKIQYISWKANWLRSLLGIYMLDFHQATSMDTENRKARMYIPLTKKENIPVLLNKYHPAIDDTGAEQFGIDKSYVYRKTFLRGLPVAVVASFAAYLFWRDFNALWFLLYLPFEFLSAFIFWKKFRLYTHPDALQVISGVWGKEVEVLKWYKIQVPEIRRSLYQRRKGLATIRLHTAGGSVNIPFIEYELALKIYNWALYKVETHNLSLSGEVLAGAE